jgi:glycosyltransferase involved in cell wall biosynthesis
MYSFPVTVLTSTEPKNAGQNRNRAVDYADTEYITMIDVDDTMHA